MDLLELLIQIAGGLAVAVMVFVVVTGLRQARTHTVEREVGRSTSYLRSPPVLIIAAILAVIVFWLLWRPLPLRLSDPARLARLVVGSLLFFPGIALIIWGRRELGAMYNVSSGMGVQIFQGHRVIKTGPFRYVRHPMYLGNALWVLGAVLIYWNWAALLLATSILSMTARAKREEQALLETLGDEYREYMRETPAFLPRFGKR